MAELGPDLEDGERYLPSGILLGEGGWAGRHYRPRHEVPPRQSFFSDGVAGLPCYPADLFAPFPGELPSPAARSKFSRPPEPQSARHGAHFSACLPCVEHGDLGMGCVYRGLTSESASSLGSRGRLLLSSASGGSTIGGADFAYACRPGARMSMPECRGRLFPRRRVHGGTGVFLPLPRLRGDMGRGQMAGAAGDAKWVLPKQDNQSAAAAAAAAAAAKQGKARTESCLPHDWAY